MKSFIKTVIAIVLLTVAFSTCKKDSTVDVTGVALSGSASITMKVGDEVSLTATVEPKNATNNKLSWKSSDATVVSVSNGTLQALKEGTADVTATAGKKSATVKVTVVPAGGAAFVAVTGITDVPTTATVGTALTLTGTVAPANATNQTIVWTVKAAGTTGATITGNTFNATAAGTATVTATIANGATATTPFTKDFDITVSAATILVTSITIAPATEVSVEVGKTVQLMATVAPDNATNKYVVYSVFSGGSFATVSSIGLVTGVAVGTAVIRAMAADGSGKYADKTVTVTEFQNGTPEHPFIVNSPETLEKVCSDTDGWARDKHYRQTANINMNGITHTPKLIIFGGSYDGSNYTISNLTCTTALAGLFAGLHSDCTVKNVRLSNVNITGSNEAGGISSQSEGVIQNCYVLSGSVTCTGSTSTGVAGGIAGFISGGAIRNCYAACSVSGYWNVGGIVGTSFGVIENSFATGSVTGNIGAGQYIGGVVGNNDKGTVRNCYATGNVSGYKSVGGVVGENYSGTVEYCYATGSVYAYNLYAGGIAGYIYKSSESNAIIRNCLALNKIVKSEVNQADQVRRIAGYNAYGGTLSNNYARSDMVVTYFLTSISLIKGLDTVDGADVAQANYSGTNSSAWWTRSDAGPEWSTSDWSFANGRLPWLLGFTGITQSPTVQN